MEMDFQASSDSAGSGASGTMSSPTPPVQSSAPSSSNEPGPVQGSQNQPENAREQAAETQRVMRKLKRHGQEIELSDEEYDSYASMGYDAQQKWQEAARIREQNQLFLKTLRENPRAILENPKLGLDIKKLAHEILYEDIESEMMTPEQRRIKELERELNGFKESDERTKATEAERRQAAEEREYQSLQDRSIREALSASKLPVNMFTYNSMVNYMSEALKAGYDVSPEQVMPYVMRDFRASMDELYSRPGGELLEMLGEANIKKLQSAILERARGRPIGQSRPEPEAPQRDPIAKTGEKGLSMEEWREDIRRRMGMN